MTKEQIEAEGWELTHIYPDNNFIFQKGTAKDGYELIYSFKNKRCSIARLHYFGLDDVYKRTNLFWQSIECKNVRTLRTICKLFV